MLRRRRTFRSVSSSRCSVEMLESRKLLAAAVVAHIYELNSSYADSLGGPALVPAGGTLSSTGYTFAAGKGLSLSGGINSSEYSIEMKFRFDSTATTGYKRVISFKNLTDDRGPYEVSTANYFWPIASSPAGAVTNGTVHNFVITREAATKKVTGYINNALVWQFTDTANDAVFSSAGNVIQFFKDNTSGGTINEQGPGFVDRIRIYNGVLTLAQVQALNAGGQPPGLAFATLASGKLTLNGTAGNDAISLTLSGTTLTAKRGATTQTFAASAVTSVFVNAGDGNDSISIGSNITKPTTLGGGNGNDSITGGGGADVIDGGLGADVMNGGGGNDTADYSGRTVGVIVIKDTHANDGQPGERDNVGNDIETLLGGSGGDVLVGNDSNELLKGNGGIDYVFGSGGNDTCDGGDGNDEVEGGGGNDSLIGGKGQDQLFGDDGNDILVANDGEKDLLDGGLGTDKGIKDSIDTVISVET